MADYKLYLIYQCSRCTKFIWDAEPPVPEGSDQFRRIGFCKIGKADPVPVKNDPQYGLKKIPHQCDDWDKGRPAGVIHEGVRAKERRELREHPWMRDE